MVRKEDEGKMVRLPSGEIGRLYLVTEKSALVEMWGSYLVGYNPEFLQVLKEKEEENKKTRRKNILQRLKRWCWKKVYIELPKGNQNFGPPYGEGL